MRMSPPPPLGSDISDGIVQERERESWPTKSKEWETKKRSDSLLIKKKKKLLQTEKQTAHVYLSLYSFAT